MEQNYYERCHISCFFIIAWSVELNTSAVWIAVNILKHLTFQYIKFKYCSFGNFFSLTNVCTKKMQKDSVHTNYNEKVFTFQGAQS
jgi:hypothetical protein